MVQEERMGRLEILETMREKGTRTECGRSLCRGQRLRFCGKGFRSKVPDR